MIKTICLLLVLHCAIVQARWQPNHDYTAEVSRLISNSIKNKIIANRALFSNQTFANALVNDLSQSNDSSRTLKEIDVNSAAELFALFGMRDYHCDKNRDGVINGEELKCLNNIWKRHVPE